MSRLFLIGVVLCSSAGLMTAQPASEFAVPVSATVQINPAQISLSWPADAQATDYFVFRKAPADSSWGAAVATLPGTATNYTDSNVAVGGAYEYCTSKVFSNNWGNGFIYAGIQAPLVEFRGKVVLIVDSTFSTSLSNELVQGLRRGVSPT